MPFHSFIFCGWFHKDTRSGGLEAVTNTLEQLSEMIDRLSIMSTRTLQG